jgi:hypothetical protein
MHGKGRSTGANSDQEPCLQEGKKRDIARFGRIVDYNHETPPASHQTGGVSVGHW